MVIDSILINGNPKDFIRSGDITKVAVGTPIPQGNTIAARIYYHGNPPTGGFFSGVTTDYSSEYQ